MNIKPIETAYKGYRFRSRLEARWAVFFDALGLEWEYEPEGFDLEPAWIEHNARPDTLMALARPDSFWYLPDFWLPSCELRIEIKPRVEGQYSPDRDTETKAFLCNAIVVMGSPTCIKTTWGYEASYTIWASDEQHLFGYCPVCKTFGEGFLGWAERICSDEKKCGHNRKEDLCYSEPMLKAYEAAMSARFEHGETPNFSSVALGDTELPF